MRRPLDFELKIWDTTLIDGITLEKKADIFHHEQIFFEDKQGGNIGFFGDSQIKPDDPSLLHKYTNLDNKHYDDSIMRRAVEEVRKSGMFKHYSFISNNCQNFVESVKAKYFDLGGK